MQRFDAKMALLTVAVSSCMWLTACSNGNSVAGRNQLPTDPAASVMRVSSITNNTLEVGKLATFTITGQNLSKDIRFDAPNCSGLTQTSASVNQVVFSCIPNKAGEQTLQIMDNTGKQIYSQKVIISNVQPIINTAKINTVTFDTKELMEGQVSKFTLTGENLTDKLSIALTGCKNQQIIEQTSSKIILSCLPTQAGQQKLTVSDNNKEVYSQNFNIASLVIPEPNFNVSDVKLKPNVIALSESELKPVENETNNFIITDGTKLKNNQIFIYNQIGYKVVGLFDNPDGSALISTKIAPIDEIFDSLKIDATFYAVGYDKDNHPLKITNGSIVPNVALVAPVNSQSSTRSASIQNLSSMQTLSSVQNLSADTTAADKEEEKAPSCISRIDTLTSTNLVDDNKDTRNFGYGYKMDCGLGELLGDEGVLDQIKLTGELSNVGKQRFIKDVSAKTEYEVKESEVGLKDFTITANSGSVKSEDLAGSSSPALRKLDAACKKLSASIPNSICEAKLDSGEINLSLKRPLISKKWTIKVVTPTGIPVIIPLYTDVGLSLEIKFNVIAGILQMNYKKQIYTESGYRNGIELNSKPRISEDDKYPQFKFGDSQFTGEAEVALKGYLEAGAGLSNQISLAATTAEIGGYASSSGKLNVGKSVCLTAETGIKGNFDSKFLKMPFWDGFSAKIWETNQPLWSTSIPTKCDEELAPDAIKLNYIITGRNLYQYDQTNSTATKDVYNADRLLTVDAGKPLHIDFTQVKDSKNRPLDFEVVVNNVPPHSFYPTYTFGTDAAGRKIKTGANIDLRSMNDNETLSFKISAFVPSDKDTTLVSKDVEIHTNPYVVATPEASKEYGKLCYDTQSTTVATEVCNAWIIRPKFAGDTSQIGKWFIEFSDGNRAYVDNPEFYKVGSYITRPYKAGVEPIRMGIISKVALQNAALEDIASFFEVKKDFAPHYIEMNITPTQPRLGQPMYLAIKGSGMPKEIPLSIPGCDSWVQNLDALQSGEVADASQYRYYRCVPNTIVTDAFASVTDSLGVSNTYTISDKAMLNVSNTAPSVGEKVTLTLTNLGSDIKSIYWKVADKFVSGVSEIATSIEYVFDQVGQFFAEAFVTYNDSNVAKDNPYTSIQVQPARATITAVTPASVVRTQPQDFVLTATSLPSAVSVKVPADAQCNAPTNVSATSMTVRCLFNTLGQNTIQVFDGNSQPIGSASVDVKTNVTNVTWNNGNNGTIKFGDTITYTVEGVGLTSGMGFAVEKCGVSNTEVGTGTDTRRTFQCWFNPEAGAVAGNMKLEVKDKPTGQVLYIGSVPVEVAPTYAGDTTKLTATGITWCANGNTNNLVCNASSLSDWFGLLQDGEVQAGQAMSYSPAGDGSCIKDNVTGLTWEQKTDDGGLRDKDNTYQWYSTDNSNNGGSVGYENNGVNTQAYIAQLNASRYCGYSNWRLPTKDELHSIVDYGRYNPAINPIFTNTQSGWYWSSSPGVDYSANAWGVYFYYGYDSNYGKSNSYYVRAVRSGS